jgi:hypothetical protein
MPSYVVFLVKLALRVKGSAFWSGLRWRYSCTGVLGYRGLNTLHWGWVRPIFEPNSRIALAYSSVAHMNSATVEARLNLARKIAAISLAVWQKGVESYA